MDTDSLYFGAFRLDPANARLMKHSTNVPLPPKALAALIYLVEQRGRLVGKDELLDAVWGHRFVSQGALKNTVATLRQALDDDPKAPRYIETVHRLGYRFIAEVETDATPATDSASTAAVPTLAVPSGLVGREQPLAELDRLMKNAALGKPQLAFVTGEPGIGKTALIEAFLQSTAQRVLRGCGQCAEQYGQGEPYLPVLEALNELVHSDEVRLVSLMKQVAPTWLAQLPWYLNETDQLLLQQVMAGATQLRMLREFGEFLGRCSAEKPLILVLEDLHWSDRATLDLLSYLARRKQPERWLILGSYRPENVMLSDHVLKHVHGELQIQGLCSNLPLPPLSVAAIGDYLQQHLSTPILDDRWARTLHSRTGGLPFFLVQLVETVMADQYPESEALLDSPLPEGLQQLLARQFERLPDDYRRTLQAASVAGMNFSAETVAAALAAASVDIEECLESLALLRYFIQPASEPGWYGFRHAFHREFAYRQLLPLQCARLHLRIGQWLESSRQEEMASELAQHFEKGREWEKAINYLHRAAKNAVGRHALYEAAQLLQRGLTLLEDELKASPQYTRYGADMCALLAMVLQTTLGPGSKNVETIFDRALELIERLDDSPRLLGVLWGQWAFNYMKPNLEICLGSARQMLTAAESASNIEGMIGAHIALGSSLLNLGKLAQALGHARQALWYWDPAKHGNLCYSYGQDPAVCARFCEAHVLSLQGFADRAMASYQNALTLAEKLGHPYTLTIALAGITLQYVDRREPELVLFHSEPLERISEEHGFLLWQAMAAILRGWAMAMLDRTEEGVTLIQRGLDSWRSTGSNSFESRYLALLAEAQARSGNPDMGLATLADALVEIEHTAERYYETEVHHLRGQLLLQVDSSDQLTAEECFLKALAVARQQEAKILEVRASTSLARLWMEMGRQQEANEMLNTIYDWFSEGFETVDLREARALLDRMMPVETAAG